MRSTKRYAWKARIAHIPLSLVDRWSNLRRVRRSPRILITRHSGKRAYVFRDFWKWIQAEVPELSGRMEFQRLPCRLGDPSRYSLHVSWVGDTIEDWSPTGFRQAQQLQAECQRVGIPVVNDLSRLSNTTKLLGALLMGAAGVRTARTVAITDARGFRDHHAGFNFPFLIREDRGHGQPAIRVESEAELAAVDLGLFRSPIAVEFIDTRSPKDGLFRKCRYVAAGEIGGPRHLIVNNEWEVRPERRLRTPDLLREEVEYLQSPDPNHAPLQAARNALGLDVLGFDYSYDQHGRIVVWEANPFPNLNYSESAPHIGFAVRRSFAAVARLYCVRAGLPVPDSVAKMLDATVTGNMSRAAA